MKDTNPIELVEDLKSVLERYIATTLPIGRRYPERDCSAAKRLAG